jgi:hypothetical protein
MSIRKRLTIQLFTLFFRITIFVLQYLILTKSRLSILRLPYSYLFSSIGISSMHVENEKEKQNPHS